MKNLLYLVLLGGLIASCQSPKKEATETTGTESSDSLLVNHAVVNKDSCANGIYMKYAHAYSNLIVDNQGYILEKNMEFTQALDRKESDEKVVEVYKKLVDQTQASIDSVEKLCPFNGNVELKQAAVELFKFYQSAWSEYKELIDVKGDKERAKVFAKISSRFNEVHSKTEKELEDKFIKAHTAFSNEYELHTRTTPLSDKLDSLLYSKRKNKGRLKFIFE